MATRALKAAALLAIIVVASADRALLQQTGGNSLHGVAITSGSSTTSGNYYITNGNGTWAYSKLYGTTYGKPNTAYATAANAVGAATASAGIQYYYGSGLNAITFPSKNLGVAVGAQTAAASGSTGQAASIIITTDQALTWVAVTGLPLVVPAPTATTTATPPAAAGDLIDVYFASKSVGWAVGSTTAGAEASTGGLSAGVVYATYNGGTVWESVPVYTATVSAGGLYGISADAAGKNVYAVGAPPLTNTITGTGSTATYSWASGTLPTIIYSGNGGASWVQQFAPASVNGYTLLDVAVQKGTTAYAVGGTQMASASSCPTGFAAMGGCLGTVIYTTNGGFSWVAATIPSASNAPAFTTVSLNAGTIWVGGFVRQDAHWPVAPVTGYVQPVTGTYVGTGQSPTNGQAYNLLMSTNGKTFVAAGATSTFPAGFVKSKSADPPFGTTAALVTYDVLGITWDNSQHGWIFGTGFVIATQDGGKTWAFETPGDVLKAFAAASSATSPSDLTVVSGVANVPTSY